MPYNGYPDKAKLLGMVEPSVPPPPEKLEVATIPGNVGKWDVSTENRCDIRRSINFGLRDAVAKHGPKAIFLKLFLSPGQATLISQSNEMIQYWFKSSEPEDIIKASENCLPWIFGLPRYFYGVKIEIACNHQGDPFLGFSSKQPVIQFVGAF